MTFVQKIKHVFTYGFGSFLNEIAGHFTIGLMISALISTIIPDDFFVSAGLDNGILAMLTMVIVGIPMYICSTSSIPIAVSLVLKGLSPGAAFVFLFTGPVTNAASVTILLKTLGKKITAIYLSCVVVCSVGFGLLLDFIAATFTAEFFDITSMHTHEHGTPFYYYIVAIVFGLLLVRSLIIRLKETIKS